jgi:iron complex outermembrane recepter protein
MKEFINKKMCKGVVKMVYSSNLFTFYHGKKVSGCCISVLIVISLVFCTAISINANQLGDVETGVPDLTELSIQDLMRIEIVSVSKKAQRLSDAAAAIFVVTQEDIRRSGSNSIPDALRMVPGLQVARIDTNKWAISSRGFNSRNTNKLLVLMDGRTVYTPLFSGAFWDTEDTVLEDIDRIEVIRGPGATLWGANAVNGVINIITKKAKETQGTLVVGGVGTEEQVFGTVRHGGKFNEDVFFRIYGKYLDRDDSLDWSGEDAGDAYDMVRAGFRLDWDDSFTLLGNLFENDAKDTIRNTILTPPYYEFIDEDIDSSGGHVLLRWEQTLSDASDISIQFYYDRTEYNLEVIGTEVDTFDFELQHQFTFGERQEIIWGIGYRFIHDDLDNSPYLSITPSSDDYDLLSAFIQNDISFMQHKLKLTLGSKFEYNDFTGFEIQPNLRLLWTPQDRYSVWASVSRAVRTPNRVEDGLQIDTNVLPAGSLLPIFPGTGIVRIYGNRDFDAEDLTAFEIGYRSLLKDNLSMDVTVFYNIYDDLRDSQPATPFPDMSVVPPVLILPAVIENIMDGETFGVELAFDYRPVAWWTLKFAYTFLKIQLDSDSMITQADADEGGSPRNQLSLRSSMDCIGNVEFDFWTRYVDSLSAQDIDSYITLDARLAWTPKKNVELALIGQNLFDRSHPEFVPQFLQTTPTEVERGVYLKITCEF